MTSDDSRDRLDVAAELQAKFNEKGLAEVRKAMAAETHPDFDGVHCLDCDDEIPAARLAMHRIRCVHCQSLKEKRR